MVSPVFGSDKTPYTTHSIHDPAQSRACWRSTTTSVQICLYNGTRSSMPWYFYTSVCVYGYVVFVRGCTSFFFQEILLHSILFRFNINLTIAVECHICIFYMYIVQKTKYHQYLWIFYSFDDILFVIF